MAQLAVAWVLHNPNVASAIVGASRPEQVVDNAAAAGTKLSPELPKRIDEILGTRQSSATLPTDSPAEPSASSRLSA